MIATVLDELRASAEADLPGWIRAVASARDVALNDTVRVRDWYAVASQQLTLEFPAFSIEWARTRTGRRTATGERTARHTVLFVYELRSLDPNEIRRHIVYVPEAILRWLDEFPVANRFNGKTILAVGPTNAGDEYEITPELTPVKQGDKTTLIWSVDVALEIEAHDPTLPAAPLPAP
jgi:hypothetical protein